MVTTPTSTINRDIQILFSAGSIGRLSDGELLERFVTRRDEAAFAAIVERHGPMVLGVCRRTLRNNHDAEDAFQASFLVLARKASSVEPREMVANWLYGVAFQTAVKARAIAIRQRARERQTEGMPEPEAAPQTGWDELQPLLDEELSRLPDKYRVPIVLCLLEGMSHREAASRLGWPEGTLSGRLSRTKALLASRLARRGLAFSGGSLFALMSQNSASASVPASLMSATARTACLFAAGQAVATGEIVALTQGVLTSMLLSNIMMRSSVVMGLTVIVGLASGATLFGNQNPPEKGSEPPAQLKEAARAPASSPKEATPMIAELYAIKWSVSENGQEAKQGPSVTCVGGHPTHFHVGSRVDAPEGRSVPVGFTCSTTIDPAKDGKICVHIRAEKVASQKLDPPAGNEVRIGGETLQLIKVVKLGEKLDLEINPAKGDPAAKPTRLELTVSKAKE